MTKEKLKEYGKECPKCNKQKSINFSNEWSTNKKGGGVVMHWSCNSCGETFIK